MTSAADKLARQIEALRRQVKAMARTPQLPFSSIDNGSLGITTPDANGNPQTSGIVGVQHDGTTTAATVTGPPPPIPSGLTVTAVAGGLKVVWDGTFVDPQPSWPSPVVAPMDFAGINVQVSNDSSFPNTTPASNLAHIVSAAGGEAFIPWLTPGELVYVRLRTRSLAGKFSDPGTTVGPIATGLPGSRIFMTPAAPTPPDGGFAPGDMWVDTGDGNTVRIWGTSTTVPRTNLATNPDALSSTNADVLAWQAFAGTGGTSTGALNTGTGAVTGTGFFRATWSVAPTANGGIYVVIGAVTVAQAYSGRMWVRSSKDQTMRLGVEWHNMAGAVISTAWGQTYGCAKNVWTEITFTNIVAPALAVSASMVAYNAPLNTPGVVNWAAGNTLDGDRALFEPSAVLYSYFDGSSGGEARWNGVINASTSSDWQEDTSGPYDWQDRKWRTGAIQAQAITAELLTAFIILASVIIAGDPNGFHSRMTPTGFQVFRPDPDRPGYPEVVGHFGSDSDDFIGLTNDLGVLVASIDDTGAASFDSLSVNTDPYFQGKPLSTILSDNSAISYRGAYYIGSFAGRTPQIRNEIGLVQFAFPIISGHSYSITVNGPFMHWGTGFIDGYPGQTAGLPSEVQLIYRVATTTGATPVQASVTAPSPEIHREFHSGIPDYYYQNMLAQFTYDSAVTGQASLLVSAQCLYGDTSTAAAWDWVLFSVSDLGPTYSRPATFNTAGGTWFGGGTIVNAAQRQYDTGEMAPAGWETYNGSLVKRTDTTDVIQGLDPSGFNGDGRGYWWWNIPTITGTVDEAWIYLYASHWYYNSGGTALIAMTDSAGGTAPHYLTSLFPHPNWPRPGGRWIQLSAPDANAFKTGQRGFIVGPASSSDLNYYVRFSGPAARLRIKYTQ